MFTEYRKWYEIWHPLLKYLMFTFICLYCLGGISGGMAQIFRSEPFDNRASNVCWWHTSDGGAHAARAGLALADQTGEPSIFFTSCLLANNESSSFKFKLLFKRRAVSIVRSISFCVWSFSNFLLLLLISFQGSIGRRGHIRMSSVIDRQRITKIRQFNCNTYVYSTPSFWWHTFILYVYNAYLIFLKIDLSEMNVAFA